MYSREQYPRVPVCYFKSIDGNYPPRLIKWPPAPKLPKNVPGYQVPQNIKYAQDVPYSPFTLSHELLNNVTLRVQTKEYHLYDREYWDGQKKGFEHFLVLDCPELLNANALPYPDPRLYGASWTFTEYKSKKLIGHNLVVAKAYQFRNEPLDPKKHTAFGCLPSTVPHHGFQLYAYQLATLRLEIFVHGRSEQHNSVYRCSNVPINEGFVFPSLKPASADSLYTGGYDDGKGSIDLERKGYSPTGSTAYLGWWGRNEYLGASLYTIDEIYYLLLRCFAEYLDMYKGSYDVMFNNCKHFSDKFMTAVRAKQSYDSSVRQPCLSEKKYADKEAPNDQVGLFGRYRNWVGLDQANKKWCVYWKDHQ